MQISMSVNGGAQAQAGPALVALTARSDSESRERTEAAGFDLHLVKPVDPAQLVAVVDALAVDAASLVGSEHLAKTQRRKEVESLAVTLRLSDFARVALSPRPVFQEGTQTVTPARVP